MKTGLVSFIFVLLLVGCSPQISESFIDYVPNPESTVLLYEEDNEKGTMVLYKDEIGFRHAFYSNKLEYWTYSGNADLYPHDGFTWTMINDPNVPIATFAGVLTNSDIEEVYVKQKTLEKEAKIVQTEEGFSVWFVCFDALEEADSGQSDPLKIEATDKDGQVLWKEGIYNGVLFRGSTLQP